MRVECPECGFWLAGSHVRFCPKCDCEVHSVKRNRVYAIDVVHQGESEVEALRKLQEGIDYALRHRFKGLKVIHGYGSSGYGSMLKERVVAAMKRYAREHGAKFVSDRGNPGAHLLYF